MLIIDWLSIDFFDNWTEIFFFFFKRCYHSIKNESE